MGEARRKAKAMAAVMEAIPGSFLDLVVRKGKLAPAYERLVPDVRAILGAALARDMEISDGFGDPFYPVVLFVESHRRSLTLQDLGATWASGLLADMRTSIEDEVDPDGFLTGHDPDDVAAALSGGGVFSGRVDGDLLDFLTENEMTSSWRQIQHLSGDDYEAKDFGASLRRISDAHAVGVTLEDIAKGAWDLIADDGRPFELINTHPRLSGDGIDEYVRATMLRLAGAAE